VSDARYERPDVMRLETDEEEYVVQQFYVSALNTEKATHEAAFSVIGVSSELLPPPQRIQFFK
jgi:hypothetical protein